MDSISTLIVLLLIPVVAFFVLRQVMLWYWRTSELVEAARETAQAARETRDAVRALAAAVADAQHGEPEPAVPDAASVG